MRQVLEALFAALIEELSQPGGRVEIEHLGALESRLVKNSPRGRLMGKHGIIRVPPKDRLAVTYRMKNTLYTYLFNIIYVYFSM